MTDKHEEGFGKKPITEIVGDVTKPLKGKGYKGKHQKPENVPQVIIGEDGVAKIRHTLVLILCGAIGAAAFLLATGQAKADSDSPGCTWKNPNPTYYNSICVAYGKSCYRWLCAYPPGTPGKYDVTGRYKP